MNNSIELERIRLERDIIVRSSMICEISRMRIYSEYFDTGDWREGETFRELADQFTAAVSKALSMGRIDKETIAGRIEVILRRDHFEGIYGMEEALALAVQVQRIITDLKIGEPVSPTITY